VALLWRNAPANASFHSIVCSRGHTSAFHDGGIVAVAAMLPIRPKGMRIASTYQRIASTYQKTVALHLSAGRSLWFAERFCAHWSLGYVSTSRKRP
jgi:hypothetical protein